MEKHNGTRSLLKQVYRRRYESRRSSKPKLHSKPKKIKYGEKRFSMADGILTPCNVAGGSGMTCHWIRPNVRIGQVLSAFTGVGCSQHLSLDCEGHVLVADDAIAAFYWWPVNYDYDASSLTTHLSRQVSISILSFFSIAQTPTVRPRVHYIVIISCVIRSSMNGWKETFSVLGERQMSIVFFSVQSAAGSTLSVQQWKMLELW